MPEIPIVSIVADATDKFAALDRALDEAGFEQVLGERLEATGKDPEDLVVVIKPNMMMFLNRKDPTTHVDPELVDHLARRLRAEGVRNIYVGETENILSKFFDGHDVFSVARLAGYTHDSYEIRDLSADAEPYEFGGCLGSHRVSRLWRDADFRISFAKNKTHVEALATLSLKNVYGVTPEQDKYWHYHKQREYDEVTIDMLAAFDVHFGIIDAWVSADGLFGFRGDPTPEHTHTILASRDLLALDWMGCAKMGIDPMDSSVVKLAVKRWGKPVFHVRGDTTPYPDWENVPTAYPVLEDALEEAYATFAYLTHSILLPPDPAFREKNQGWFQKVRDFLHLKYGGGD